VVAVGVETSAHLDFLRQHGCDELQGYYFSRPVPAAGMEALLRGPTSADCRCRSALAAPRQTAGHETDFIF
jgi:predicted signal transduction protein with EAL and GGDEF domain